MSKYCLCLNSNIPCETNCQGRVGVGRDSIVLEVACFPYWVKVGHVWQNVSSKTSKHSAPLWEWWILFSMLGLRDVETMARVDLRRIPSVTLRSSQIIIDFYSALSQ